MPHSGWLSMYARPIMLMPPSSVLSPTAATCVRYQPPDAVIRPRKPISGLDRSIWMDVQSRIHTGLIAMPAESGRANR
ncbi:hypothetical protein BX600DRAFT_459172 [Xylariales sp. PMI_506]|nr:hypothetical protein BX600DRAFT_459172 [Xylariales sp. PMI_506]